MAITAAATTDVASALGEILETVEGLRVFHFVADTVRPPAVVIGQPTLDFVDQSSGFCKATWYFALTVITTRANERAAQADMSKFLLDIATALGGDAPEGILSIEPISARPVSGVSVNGQELPAYELSVRVRA